MERWTIDELSEVVARVLEDAPAPASGRVTAVPDKRTIRYYTTLGLLDAPAEMRGRTAYYGRRHLLQLVAIKRLQAEGVKLSQVQQRLAGQPEGVLAQLARVPDVLPAASSSLSSSPSPAASASTTARRGESFWASPSAALAEAEPEMVDAVDEAPSVEGRAVAEKTDGAHDELAQARTVMQISVGQGAMLVVPFARGALGSRELLADDLAALRRAAGPLLEELARRGLTQRRKS